MELTTAKDGIAYLLYAASEYRIADAPANPQKSNSYFSHLEQTLNQLDSSSFKTVLDPLHHKLSEALEERHQYVKRQCSLLAIVLGGNSLAFGAGAAIAYPFSSIGGMVLAGVSVLMLLTGTAGVAKITGMYAPQKVAMKLIENARESNWQNVMRSREDVLRKQIYRYRDHD